MSLGDLDPMGNLAAFLFAVLGGFFMLMVVLDWLRDRKWSREEDPTLELPEGEPSPALQMHRRLARDNGRRQSAAWNPARYRTQHVPQPRPLEMEE